MRRSAGDTETRRLAALHAVRILDTPREERFDRLTRLAALILDVPIAAIGFIDADRHWFKSTVGVELREIPLDISFCAGAVLADEPLVVPDAQRDTRFAANPLVTGDARLRFYAGHPVHAPSGEPLGSICVFDRDMREPTDEQLAGLRDLAGIVELELAAASTSSALLAEGAERRALGRMQDEFIRLAAHELRTPLTSVLGFAELLAEDGGDLSERHRGAADAILRNARRLEVLTNDLLLVLRLESGHVDLRLEEVDVAAIAREVLGGAPAPGGAVAAPVKADPALVRRALVAMAEHARARGGADAPVRVTVSAGADGATVTVRDAGPSLPAEELEALTRPFHRAARSGPQEGAGLDLAIARGVADAHGGAFDVRCPAEGGVVTELRLPLRPPAG